MKHHLKIKWESIKFYGKTAKMMDQESAVGYIKQLVEKYGINSNIGYKTPSFKYFKFLQTDDFELLRSYHHLVTVNYGINPIWCLFLTTDSQTKQKMSLYINLVTQQVIWSKHRFADDLYRGTMFEGEFIREKFMIWDLMVSKNRNCLEYFNLNQRIDIIKTMLDQHYQSDPLVESFPIEIKTYVTYPYIKSFIEQLKKDEPHHKGISFIPIQRSVKCYSIIFDRQNKIEDYPKFLNQLTDQDIEPHEIEQGKIETPENDEEMIQEFWLAPLPNFRDNYHIYHWTYNKIYDLGPVAIISTKTSLMLYNAFKENSGQQYGSIKNLLKFKCQYLPKFRKWEPIEQINNPK